MPPKYLGMGLLPALGDGVLLLDWAKPGVFWGPVGAVEGPCAH